MSSRRHPTAIAVISGVIFMSPAHGDLGRPDADPAETGGPAMDNAREKKAEKAKADKVAGKLNAAAEAWFKKPEASRPPYSQMLKRAVDLLSDDEIPLAGVYQPDPDFNQEVFRRWGMRDANAALKAVRQVEDANAAEISLAGTGLEGGPGEAVSAFVFEMYLGAVEGWARTAPKATSDEFKNKRGVFAKSEVVKDYFSSFHRPIFEALAKADADFAFAEIAGSDAKDYVKEFMLDGYLRGAPNGQDWRKRAEQLLEEGGDWSRYKLRCALMGRWMEDDAAAAEKWFGEGEVEELHWTYAAPLAESSPGTFVLPGEEPQPAVPRRRRRCSLGEAAGYWAARDLPAATRWMKMRDDLHREKDFGRCFFAGVEDYCDGEKEARYYLRKQLAKLPDQADRDFLALRFAQVLWEFDGTEFLGEPPPDKGKWLKEVRTTFSPLALTPEAERKIIEKLR